MASLELGTLSQSLDDEDEVAQIVSGLSEADIELELDEDADPRLLERDLDDDLMADFLDQLDANDALCDVYVPTEFEDFVECGEYRVGSAQALLLVLDEMRDDIFEGEDDGGDGDEDDFSDDEGFGSDTGFASLDAPDSMELKDGHMRHFWKLMYEGAKTSVREQTCLFIKR